MYFSHHYEFTNYTRPREPQEAILHLTEKRGQNFSGGDKDPN